MKITGSRGSDLVRLYSQAGKKGQSVGDHAEDRKDEVSISERGKELLRAMKALSQASDVRDDKVDQIRRSIEAGTYDVRGEDIAKLLVSRALRRGDLHERLQKPDDDSQ